MSRDNILKKLNYLGINNAEQLEKQDLNHWWRIKYKENKDSNEELSKLDKIIDELEKYPKNQLISLLLNEQINLLKAKERDLKFRSDNKDINQKDQDILSVQQKTENLSKKSKTDVPINEYQGSPQFQKMMAKMIEKKEKPRKLKEQIKILDSKESKLIEKGNQLHEKRYSLKEREANLDNKLMNLRIKKNLTKFGNFFGELKNGGINRKQKKIINYSKILFTVSSIIFSLFFIFFIRNEMIRKSRVREIFVKGEEELIKKNYKKAKYFFNKALELNPDFEKAQLGLIKLSSFDAEKILLKGYDALKNGDYDLALSFFDEVSVKYPNSEGFNYALGLTYSELFCLYGGGFFKQNAMSYLKKVTLQDSKYNDAQKILDSLEINNLLCSKNLE